MEQERRPIQIEEFKDKLNNIFKELTKAKAELRKIEKKIDEEHEGSPKLVELGLKRNKQQRKIESIEEELAEAQEKARKSWVEPL